MAQSDGGGSAEQGREDGDAEDGQVAAVYTIDRFVREPGDIVRDLAGDPRGPAEAKPARPRPRPQGKRVWASLVHEAHEVVGEAFAEAERVDPARRKDWVVLVDGGEHQLDCVLEYTGARWSHDPRTS